MKHNRWLSWAMKGPSVKNFSLLYKSGIHVSIHCCIALFQRLEKMTWTIRLSALRNTWHFFLLWSAVVIKDSALLNSSSESHLGSFLRRLSRLMLWHMSLSRVWQPLHALVSRSRNVLDHGLLVALHKQHFLPFFDQSNFTTYFSSSCTAMGGSQQGLGDVTLYRCLGHHMWKPS